APIKIYLLSLHDALPISPYGSEELEPQPVGEQESGGHPEVAPAVGPLDRSLEKGPVAARALPRLRRGADRPWRGGTGLREDEEEESGQRRLEGHAARPARPPPAHLLTLRTARAFSILPRTRSGSSWPFERAVSHS